MVAELSNDEPLADPPARRRQRLSQRSRRHPPRQDARAARPPPCSSAPSTAGPSAPPTWRNALLPAAAMPACRGSTAEVAVPVMHGNAMPSPRPSSTRRQARDQKEVPASSAVSVSRAAAAISRPEGISTLGGTVP